MGGRKNKGPAGPTMQEQYNTAREGYQLRARDFAAEGGGLYDVNPESPDQAKSIGGLTAVMEKKGKQGALDDYKNRMESKFKKVGPGNLRDIQAQAGEGTGSTNIRTGVKTKQVLGEEEKRKASLFA